MDLWIHLPMRVGFDAIFFWVYYGSTIGTLHIRHKTGKPLVIPEQSSFQDQVITCGSGISMEHFKNVAIADKKIKLRIIESIFTYKDKPILEDTKSSFPLKLL